VGLPLRLSLSGDRGAHAPCGQPVRPRPTLYRDLAALPADREYQRTGITFAQRTGMRSSAIYTRLPGESWILGVGFAVIR